MFYLVPFTLLLKYSIITRVQIATMGVLIIGVLKNWNQNLNRKVRKDSSPIDYEQVIFYFHLIYEKQRLRRMI